MKIGYRVLIISMLLFFLLGVVLMVAGLKEEKASLEIIRLFPNRGEKQMAIYTPFEEGAHV